MHILDVAHQIDRIEVSGRSHHLLVILIGGVHLIALEYLRRSGAVGIDSYKRTAAGLALVTHHATHTQRAVELTLYILYQLIIGHVIKTRVIDIEHSAHIFHHTLEIGSGVDFLLQSYEVLLYLVMDFQQQTAEYLLIFNSVAAQRVGHHIVDVFDKHHRALYVIEILYERAVTAGTEQQMAILAERSVVRIGGDSVGRRLLLAHRHKKLLAGAGLGLRYHLIELGLEKSAVIGRNGKVKMHLTLGVGRGLRALGQMLLHRSARPFGI